MGKLVLELVYELPNRSETIIRTSDLALLRLVKERVLNEAGAIAKDSREIDKGLAVVYAGEYRWLRTVLEKLLPDEPKPRSALSG